MTKLRIFLILLLAGCSSGSAPAQQQPLTTITFPPYINTLPVAGALTGSEPMLVLQGGQAFQASVTTVRGTGVGVSTANPNTWAAVQTFTGIRVAVRSSSLAAVTVTTTDYFLCLDPSANPITVTLPSGPVLGQTYLIKDCTGKSNSHGITVTPSSGNIDGGTSVVLSIPFQSIGVTYTGVQWSLD